VLVSEDQQWIGTCEQFADLSWLARSPQVALAGIRDVVRDAVADLVESGQPLLPLRRSR
jgi:hypothetical protein